MLQPSNSKEPKKGCSQYVLHRFRNRKKENPLRRYALVFTSAFFLEIGSTMYINAVSDKAMAATMFWAFLGPFIALPFAGLVADEKTWSGRAKIALASSLGYVVGAAITMSIIL